LSEVRWSAQSLADIEDLLSYCDAIDPEIARHIEQRIVISPDILTRHPQAGPGIGDTDLRKWRVHRLPFLILYRAADGYIEVDRVLHAKQNWRRSH
jgi:plasmid stabilization system protein ParE